MRGCNGLTGEKMNSDWLNAIKDSAARAHLENSFYYHSLEGIGAEAQQVLKKYVGECISDKPLWIISDHENKQVKEVTVAYKKNPDTKEYFYLVEFGDIVLDAYPESITISTDPLEELTKYTITFTTNKGANISLGPLTLADMSKELMEKTSLVYKPRVLKERLNAVINAYIAHRKVEYKTEIEREGFFWIEGKLRMSKVACMKDQPEPTKEQVRDALNFIAEIKERFYATPTQIERLAHLIKWALVAPYDFARRQAGITSVSNNFLPRLDLYGEPNSGKTNGTKYAVLGMYGLAFNDEHVLAYGSCDTQPRFINKTSRSTMPVIIDEADELTHWAKERHAERMLSLLKNQTTQIAPRTTLTKESDEIIGYSLSPYIITHNSDRIDEDGFLKRVTSIQHTTEDKKTDLQMKQFEDYMVKNIERYVSIGRFAIGYVLEHQSILVEKWNVIADMILDALYSFAGIEKPDWLHNLIINTSKEDQQEHRRGLIRQMLVNLINDHYIKHRHSIEETLGEIGMIDQTDIMSKFQALLSIHILPEFHLKSNDDLLIFSNMKTHLEKIGLDRVSSIKAFAELCGFKYEQQNKINGRNVSAAVVNLTDFAAFLAIRLEEPTTDAGQATLTNAPIA